MTKDEKQKLLDSSNHIVLPDAAHNEKKKPEIQQPSLSHGGLPKVHKPENAMDWTRPVPRKEDGPTDVD